MRTAAQHEAYIRLIQEQAMDSFRGVKGPSAVSTLIKNLPLTAPVDYMHQVLLSVTRALRFLLEINRQNLISTKFAKTVLLFN